MVKEMDTVMVLEMAASTVEDTARKSNTVRKKSAEVEAVVKTKAKANKFKHKTTIKHLIIWCCSP